jgi:MerR family transcriptional regulator, copper efflux regulator
MQIGEVAVATGVESHVLRHWDEVGVVVPDRLANGHRVYTDAHVAQVILVRQGQRAGMSLPQIRTALHGSAEARAAVLQEQAARLRDHERELALGRRLLEHAAVCPRDLLRPCETCAAIAAEFQRGS